MTNIRRIEQNSDTLSVDGLEQVLLDGNLAKLSSEQRIQYYQRVCSSVGLNPLTQPFEYLTLQGKMVLYARRAATDQLRKIHNVSIRITSREHTNGVYVVTAQASTADGRCDESIGATALEGLKGENLVNAMLKAETKAKRRVTLAICGLSMLDESELDGVRNKIDKPAVQNRTLDDVAAEPEVNTAELIRGLTIDLPQCQTKAALVHWAKELLAIKASAEEKKYAWAEWGVQCAEHELVPAELAKEARAV